MTKGNEISIGGSSASDVLKEFDKMLDGKASDFNLVLGDPKQRISMEGRGRLMFMMDATASRDQYWEHSKGLMSDMFSVVQDIKPSLSVKLSWFNASKLFQSRWHTNPENLKKIIEKVRCESGLTQIARILGHAADESKECKIGTVVYIGDSSDHEDLESICAQASRLKEAGSKLFIFDDLECSTSRTGRTVYVFKEAAKAAGGIYMPFNDGSSQQIKDYLHVAAVYATGGKEGVMALGNVTKTTQGQEFKNKILALN